MPDENLEKEIPLTITIGRLLLIREILANKLAGSSVLDTYDDDEQRSVGALQDLCDVALQANGFGSRPKDDRNRLIQAARERVRHIPLEFEDLWPVL